MARTPLSLSASPGQSPAGARKASSLRTKVWLALGVVYVVWGSTYLGIDLAVRTIPPFLMASVRFMIAGGLLYAWAIRRGDRRDRPTPRHWLIPGSP